MPAISSLLGYAAMTLLGVTLGLLGAGGSILTVPVLVYLFAIAPSQATGYSLAIVGTTAAAGAAAYWQRQQNDLKMALVFGLPSLVSVYLTRRYLFPALPDPLIQTGDFVLSKDLAIMIFFAIFMLAAAAAMIFGKKEDDSSVEEPQRRIQVPLIASVGFFISILTGLVGAGGGFLILPILMLLGRLPIKVAIGTSLLIIAVNSLLGFVGEMQTATTIDYGFVATLIILPLTGMALGMYLNKIASASKLKPALGYFVLLMAIYIIGKELLFA